MDIWHRLVAVNIHPADRVGRVVLGIAGIALALAVPTGWGWVGLYPLFTGLLGTSPLYLMLGIGVPARRGATKPPHPMPPITPKNDG